MSPCLLPLLPLALALALPVAPALAGEEDDNAPGAGTATLHAPDSCKAGHRLRAWVTGDNIDHVPFYVAGRRVGSDDQAGSAGRYRLSMSCSRPAIGANRARAAVAYTSGTTPARQTLRFQVTRLRQTSPRFTG